MPIARTFRNRKVKRTKKIGDRVLVIFEAAHKGLRGDQLELALADFLAERQVEYHPPQVLNNNRFE